MPHLFEPLPLRALTLANRILVSPMCQYSSVDGFSNDWHFVHLGSRAVGGAGAGVHRSVGRDAGRPHQPARSRHLPRRSRRGLARIVRFIHAQGTLAGMQLAHAGRKGSTAPPWEGGGRCPAVGGRLAARRPDRRTVRRRLSRAHALTVGDSRRSSTRFVDAAERALRRGIRRPRSPRGARLPDPRVPVAARQHAHRRYGGSFDNRVRLCLEIVRRGPRRVARALPLFVRISATDWMDGGWDVEQSVSWRAGCASAAST